MKKESELPFERARRVTREENQQFRRAIAEQFGMNLGNRITSATNKQDLMKRSVTPKWTKL